RYHPFIGFPLSTQLSYLAFDMPSYREGIDLHNSHLAYLFRFGLIGFSIYLLLNVSVLKSLWKNFETTNNEDVLAYFMAIVFVLILASFNVMLEGPYCGSMFW